MCDTLNLSSEELDPSTGLPYKGNKQPKEVTDLTNLIELESAQLLDFAASNVRAVYRMERRLPMITHQSENIAQHSWMVTMLALGYLDLCRQREIEPYNHIDPYFFTLQALTCGLTTAPFDGFVGDDPTSVDAHRILRDKYKESLLAALPVPFADRLSRALDNQFYNTSNLSTIIIRFSILVADMMYYLDEAMVGSMILGRGLADRTYAGMLALRDEVGDNPFAIVINKTISTLKELINADNT